MNIDKVNIWFDLTGGGKPVEYLRWLAAMWEQYAVWYRAEGDHRQPPRDQFDEWLVGRLNSGAV
jgi:hypothetical protein